jgi:fatty acid desaturase
MLSRLHTPCGRLWIDRQLLLQLSAPCSFRLLMAAIGEWLIIIALIWLAVQLAAWWATLIAVPLIATRQHALGTLMHEFSHRQWSRRHAKLNDFVGNALTAWPLLISVEGFRHDHLQHHQHVRTERDASWMGTLGKKRYEFPKTPQSVWCTLGLHLLFFYALENLKYVKLESKATANASQHSRWPQIVFTVLAILVTAWCNAWVIVGLYWVLPILTVLPLLLYMVEVAEHAALSASGGWEFSRSLRLQGIAQWLFAPYGVSLHTEHHLAPAVPVFRLYALHAELMKNAIYTEKAIVTNGYRGLIKEMTSASVTVSQSIA